jgi:N-acetylglucosamine-6-sulfatase
VGIRREDRWRGWYGILGRHLRVALNLHLIAPGWWIGLLSHSFQTPPPHSAVAARTAHGDLMSTPRRPSLLLALALVACGGSDSPAPPNATPADRPNIVVVIVDDLRFDEFGAGGHPYLETPNIDRLAREGAFFVNAFHAVPLCSPNRATLLTGQFPSRHGIIDNLARNLASHRLQTFNIPLQRSGYRTAFLGKWHMGNDPTPRPGWDYWVAMPGQGRSEDPQLFEDGRLHEVPGYMTDLLTDRAISFIEREHAAPFLVYLAHKAVHPDIVQRDDGSVDTESDRGYVPARRDAGRYADRVYPRPQQASEIAADLDGKPVIRAALTNLGVIPDSGSGEHQHPVTPWTGDETIRRRAEMIAGVDHGLGRIIQTLDSLGILDKTVIVFSSDNGFFFGEHGLTTERRLPYEESIRNPLLVRYPPRIAPRPRWRGDQRPDPRALARPALRRDAGRLA